MICASDSSVMQIYNRMQENKKKQKQKQKNKSKDHISCLTGISLNQRSHISHLTGISSNIWNSKTRSNNNTKRTYIENTANFLSYSEL